MPTFLVEAYVPRITAEACAELERQARRAARQLTAGGRAVTHLSSIFVRDDETCFHLFEAASAEDVEAVGTLAAMRQTRIVEAVR